MIYMVANMYCTQFCNRKPDIIMKSIYSLHNVEIEKSEKNPKLLWNPVFLWKYLYI